MEYFLNKGVVSNNTWFIVNKEGPFQAIKCIKIGSELNKWTIRYKNKLNKIVEINYLKARPVTIKNQ